MDLGIWRAAGGMPFVQQDSAATGIPALQTVVPVTFPQQQFVQLVPNQQPFVFPQQTQISPQFVQSAFGPVRPQFLPVSIFNQFRLRAESTQNDTNAPNPAASQNIKLIN